jgi:hypothetical protein
MLEAIEYALEHAEALELDEQALESLKRQSDMFRPMLQELTQEMIRNNESERIAAQGAAQWEAAQAGAGEAAVAAAADIDIQRQAVIELAREQGAAADPVLNLIARNRDYQTALANLQTVEGDSTASAEDLQLANEEVLRTYGDLVTAKGPFAAAMGENTQAFIDQAREAGISEDAINDFITILMGIPTDIDIDIAATVSMYGDVQRLEALIRAGGVPGVVVGEVPGFAEGGVVPGPKDAPMLATVHGGEYVLSNDMLDNLKQGIASGSPSWLPLTGVGNGTYQSLLSEAFPGLVDDLIATIDEGDNTSHRDLLELIYGTNQLGNSINDMVTYQAILTEAFPDLVSNLMGAIGGPTGTGGGGAGPDIDALIDTLINDYGLVNNMGPDFSESLVRSLLENAFLSGGLGSYGSTIIPAATAEPAVNVTVQGSVISEQDLSNLVREIIADYMRRTGTG